MDGYQYMYIACLRQVVAFAPKVLLLPASCRGFAFAMQNLFSVIKCAAYGIAQGRGWRYGRMGGRRERVRGGGGVMKPMK
jgi:hypothetical protein